MRNRGFFANFVLSIAITSKLSSVKFMKLAASLLLTCLLSICWAEEPISDPSAKPPLIPNWKKQDSPVTLLKENPDRTLLVSLRPQIYLDELGCTIVADQHGHTFSQMHHMIAFSHKDVRYYTIWGTSPGAGPPVKLDPTIDYKLLIKPGKLEKNETSISFSILKIWNGEKLIYESKEPL